MSRQSRLAHRSSLSLAVALVAVALLGAAACSKKDAAVNDTSGALAPAPVDSSVPPSTVPPATVRGTIASISDTSVTVTTSTGQEVVHLVAPVQVYTRTKSDLAHVAPNAFVGVTSVAQSDGSQRATEIHIFPEALRGTGEGSRMMDQAAGGSSSRMTNGSVASTTTGASSGSRMTNGSVATTGGKTWTVQYGGGTQTIAIPSGVAVTAITATQTKPAVGANVIVLAHKDASGRQSASTIFLLGADTPK